MNCEITKDMTSRLFAVLEDTTFIEKPLAAFLDQFPIYEGDKDKLLQECLIASAACALAASLISIGCCRETADEYTSRFRAAIEAEADSFSSDGISSGDITLVAAYLESFNYVYAQKIKKGCPSGQELLSPISNMAFLAVTRMFGSNAAWSGTSARAPILHDLFLPLLVEVFNRFSKSEESVTRH